MPMERTISSWAIVNWRDEMSRPELLAARIRQLERRPEDVEQAAERLRVARTRNKARFDRMHRVRPRTIEEGDWVLVYDSSLDNQHRATRKFAKPYVVQSANDNRTYHLVELDGTRMAIPVAGKRIKVFKKRHDDEPDPVELGSIDERSETEEEPTGKE